MNKEEYCCEDFREAVEEYVISHTDHDWYKESDLGAWYILTRTRNYVEEYDYDTVAKPIKYCPWCMTPILK